MPLPHDYIERVYAGVLGKIIGVYLGRPFEGWSFDRITAELGEIWYYVHEKRAVPLVVTDDDISGTFTFLRALPDFGNNKNITPEQIGKTWLNYLIENRTVLWWGGLGNSTEHTAYLRLKNGIPAPHSGAIETNGKVVAEQIGAQIFIDGWAMVAPDDPEFAAELARRAASVSHDGEAIYGAQVIAAIESLAFVESDTNHLINTAASLIPKDSIIYRLISDLLDWREKYPDWRAARQQIVQNYGYDRYGGNCHMVPNHALILLGLLYGEDDFQKTLMITNTSGWDTDCNSGNVGCLMGIKNGLSGIDSGPDWRGPVKDRLFLPTADGGSCITDAVQVSYMIANIGRTLAGQNSVQPKGAARFHFELPGSVQGFEPISAVGNSNSLKLENVIGKSRLGNRSLALHYEHTAPGFPAQVITPTFLLPEALKMPGYSLFACPSLYSGQIVKSELAADINNKKSAKCRMMLQRYSSQLQLETIYGPECTLMPGERKSLSWQAPASGGWPIASIGIEIFSPAGSPGTVYLDYMTWGGSPNVVFLKPEDANQAWQYSWVNAVDQWCFWSEPYRLIQNEGIGLLIQGTNDWDNYRVEADITPHMVVSSGLAARVQGLQRYYALLLTHPNKVQLIKNWCGTRKVLAEKEFDWEFGHTYQLDLVVNESFLQAKIDGNTLFAIEDQENPLLRGAIGLVCEEGRTATHVVAVQGMK